jgi:hypothetical protein
LRRVRGRRGDASAHVVGELALVGLRLFAAEKSGAVEPIDHCGVILAQVLDRRGLDPSDDEVAFAGRSRSKFLRKTRAQLAAPPQTDRLVEGAGLVEVDGGAVGAQGDDRLPAFAVEDACQEQFDAQIRERDRALDAIECQRSIGAPRRALATSRKRAAWGAARPLRVSCSVTS